MLHLPERCFMVITVSNLLTSHGCGKVKSNCWLSHATLHCYENSSHSSLRQGGSLFAWTLMS